MPFAWWLAISDGPLPIWDAIAATLLVWAVAIDYFSPSEAATSNSISNKSWTNSVLDIWWWNSNKPPKGWLTDAQKYTIYWTSWSAGIWHGVSKSLSKKRTIWPRLDYSKISTNISNWHAFKKHIHEFKSLWITTREELGTHALNIMNKVDGTENMKFLKNWRKAFWDNSSWTVVIFNPKAKDSWTIFRPKEGKEYFDKNLQ
jgi:hypothetical protein